MTKLDLLTRLDRLMTLKAPSPQTIILNENRPIRYAVNCVAIAGVAIGINLCHRSLLAYFLDWLLIQLFAIIPAMIPMIPPMIPPMYFN